MAQSPISSPPTFTDYVNIGLAEAVSSRPSNKPALSFFDGDVSLFFLQAAAAMADHLTAYAKGRFAATFLDSAEGDDLTVLANDHWNVQRLPDVESTGIGIFQRPAPGSAGSLFSGSVYETSPDFLGNTVQFTLDQNVNWLAGDTLKTGSLSATVPGPQCNIVSGSLSRIVTTAFDNTIFVYNTGTFAGGSNSEADPSLRNRVRTVPNTLNRATINALRYGAIQTVNAGVSTATVVEQTDTGGNLTGIVFVYVSDDSSPHMVQLVQAEMDNWRAAGTLVNVFGGSILVITGITVTLTVRAGFNITSMTPTIQQAVVAAVQRLRIGETLSTDIIKTAVLNVDPNNILAATVSGIASSVVPSSNQLLRTTTANVQVQ